MLRPSMVFSGCRPGFGAPVFAEQPHRKCSQPGEREQFSEQGGANHTLSGGLRPRVDERLEAARFLTLRFHPFPFVLVFAPGPGSEKSDPSRVPTQNIRGGKKRVFHFFEHPLKII